MENYKSLEAHKFFIDGWVQAITHYKSGTITVLRAKVMPSFRITEKAHNPWVALNSNSGSVITGHCDCMAG